MTGKALMPKSEPVPVGRPAEPEEEESQSISSGSSNEESSDDEEDVAPDAKASDRNSKKPAASDGRSTKRPQRPQNTANGIKVAVEYCSKAKKILEHVTRSRRLLNRSTYATMTSSCHPPCCNYTRTGDTA